MRCAVYVRMSTAEQEDSPERQKEQVLPYCKDHGYDIVEVYEDLGARGWDGTRPDFLRMLADAKGGRFQLIVVDEKSRLSRQNPIEYVTQVVQPLKEAGVYLESVDNGQRVTWDDDDLAQLLLLMVGQHQNSDESKKISRRTATGQERKASDGKYFAGPGTGKYGYRFRYDESADNKKPVRVGYAVVQEQAAIVSRIFDSYAKGMSVSDIVANLNSLGLPSPTGCPAWGKTTVHRILRDPIYAGKYVWGKVSQGKFNRRKDGKFVRHVGKKTSERQPRKNWIEKPGNHEAIVPLELFEATQARLNANKSRTSRAKGKATYLLSQLMRCSHCGATMHGTEVRGKVRAYRCASYQSHGTCAPRTVREEVILEVLIKQLQSSLLDSSVMGRLRKKLAEQQTEDNTPQEADRLEKRRSALDAKIEKAGRRLATIEDEYVDAIKSEIQDMKRELDSIQCELQGLSNRKAPTQAVDDLLEWVTRLPEIVQSKTPSAVQAYFRSMIGRVDLQFGEEKRGSGKKTWRPLVGGTIHIREDADSSLSGRAAGR